MEKILLTSKEDFKSFEKMNTGYQACYGHVKSWLGEPDKYPCVLLYETRYNSDGPDHLDGDFVYLDDFEEYSNMKQSVADIYNYIKKELDNPYYDDNAYLERIEGYRNILNFIKENEK